MKKLVIVLSMVVAAGVAKAAIVDWAVSGAAAQDGYTVYLLTSAPGDYSSVSDLAGASVANAKIAKSGRVYTTGDQKASGDKVTKDADFYFAIISGDDATSYTYLQAEGMTAMVYDPDNQESSPGKYNSATAAAILGGTTKDFAGGTGGGDDPGPGPDDPPGPGPDNPTTPGPGGDGDVPEPTSGLLLMIGGAALALRRRR